ncbi:MAG: hypothetical protein JSS49_17290 [Planctomycetes bacterium]|nr:hypothetical protein [Planctomycetota bacterium]
MSIPTLGWAQVGRLFVSVEAYVGLARVVHVGKIVELKPIDYEQPLTSIQKLGKPHRLVLAVSETIRGDAAKRLELVLSLQVTYELEYLRDQSIEIMLVGGPDLIGSFPRAEVGIEEQGQRVDGQRYQFRLLGPVKVLESGNGKQIASQLNSAYDSGRMFTDELEVVAGREAILKRSRAFASEHTQILPEVTLMVPNEFGALCGRPNAFCLITLPVCPDTRKTLNALKNDPGLVLRHIKSPDEDYDRARLLAEIEKALAKFPDGAGK